jgi:DNA-binding transcriptional ArsR family regulator
MNPESMDLVFHALASPVRRKLLDLIKERPGSSVNDLCAEFEVSRIAVMKHLGVLEEAQLIVLQKNGRRREIYFNVVPIQMIYDRWTSDYSSFWAAKAIDLKFFVENKLGTSGEATSKKKTKKKTPL